MNSILLVDDEVNFLHNLEAGLSDYKDRFNVLTAEDGKKAVHVLESTSVDLVVTDLKMPKMDGFELLAYIASHFPPIPVIIMTAFGTPEVERALKAMGILTMVEKPIDMDALAAAILLGLETIVEEGVLTGISLANFLQLIDMEQKTCLLEVMGKDKKKGFFYFSKGQLYDAMYGENKGEKAALEILGLGDVKIRLMKLPEKKTKKRIEKALLWLLIEGSRLKDEAEAAKGIAFFSPEDSARYL